jgi:hypothetical protein
MTDEEFLALKQKVQWLQDLLTLDGKPWIQGQLRITQEDDKPSLHVDHKGSSTAVVVVQDSNNPGMLVTTHGNASCLELRQKDGEDSIWAPESDGRFRQVIAERHCVKGGAVQFTEDLGAKDVEYYDGLKLYKNTDLVIGNSERNWPIRIKLGNQPLTIEANGEVLFKASNKGVWWKGKK